MRAIASLLYRRCLCSNALLRVLGSAWLAAAAMGSQVLAADAPGESLYLYCAAGIKNPVEAVVRQYEAEYGGAIEINYGGSGTLLNNLQIARQGDLFLSGESSYMEIARDKGLARETFALARMRPVIAVKAGNPRNIQTLEDLLREDVKLALANPDAASVGKQTQELLAEHGLWERAEAAVRDRGVFKPTVNELAMDVKIGSATAAIVWDSIAAQYPELEAIAIAGASTVDISIGVLDWCANPRRALHFCRYLSAPEKGGRIFEQMGFAPIPGDAWADEPEIVYFSGTVNRLAIQDSIREFEEREGVRFTTVFNGCGILVGQMKSGGYCDAYQSCDESFLPPVASLFDGFAEVSQMEIVIATRKGNPKGIRSVEDLTREGIKIGVCNEQLSALGALTAHLLDAMGLKERVMANVVVQQAVGDMLVAQLVAGDLDAVIVYSANIATRRDSVDSLPIGDEGARALQTFSIRSESRYKNILRRFFEKLKSDVSLQRYEDASFTVLLKNSSLPDEKKHD